MEDGLHAKNFGYDIFLTVLPSILIKFSFFLFTAQQVVTGKIIIEGDLVVPDIVTFDPSSSASKLIISTISSSESVNSIKMSDITDIFSGTQNNVTITGDVTFRKPISINGLTVSGNLQVKCCAGISGMLLY